MSIFVHPCRPFEPNHAALSNSLQEENAICSATAAPWAKPPITTFRLFVKTEWLGSKGRHGWTKMDTFRFRGKHWGDLGYRSKFYGTHQPCPHSGWTWKGHMGSKKSKKHWEIENQTSHQVLRSILFFLSYAWLFSSYSVLRQENWSMTKNLQKNWALSRSSLFFCILINYRVLLLETFQSLRYEFYSRYVFNSVFSNIMESTIKYKIYVIVPT